VEEADGDKGRGLLGKADRYGRHPLHHACGGVASLEVFKYLVEEVDGDKGKELLGKSDEYGRYPLHLACYGRASLNVIKYLVEEADDDKGKKLLGKADEYGRYPLHLACWKGASLNVIKHLIQKNPGPLQYKDSRGLTALDYMDNNTLRAIWRTHHQMGSVADKSSDIDRLNYLLYAQALAYAACQAEQPGTSLCVGLYGR
jgi:ankyrin repeat protein